MAVDCPKLSRRRALAFKVETTTGTAEALVAADADLDAMEPDIKYDDDGVDREGATLSNRPRIPASASGTLTFKTYLQSIGGGVPSQADVLTCCGLKLTSGTLTPLTSTDCGNTGTFGLYKHGRFKNLFGVSLDVTFAGTRNKPVEMSFSGKGKWDPDETPEDLAMITPAYIDVAAPLLRSCTFTIGGTTYKIPGFELAFGNDVQLRESIAETGGIHAADVRGHARRLTISPEALPLSTRDWYAAYRDGTEFAWNAVIGSGAADSVQFIAPKIQLFAPPEDEDRAGVYADKLIFQMNQNADAGDDEFSMVYDLTS